MYINVEEDTIVISCINASEPPDAVQDVIDEIKRLGFGVSVVGSNDEDCIRLSLSVELDEEAAYNLELQLIKICKDKGKC